MRICSVAECDSPARTAGLCGRHYHRLRRHGDPLKGGTKAGDLQRFYDEVVRGFRDPDVCLFWPFGKIRGYGVMASKNSSTKFVHRMACIERNGPPPTKDHLAIHSCGNGSIGCVNPLHTSWGTHADNKADMFRHGTVLSGEKAPWSKMNMSKAEEMRAKYKTGLHTQTELATEYGVSATTVLFVVNNRRWI